MEQNKFKVEVEKTQEQKRNEEIKERYRSFRMYVKIISMVGNLVGTILLGILAGYFVSEWTDNDIWMPICIIALSIYAMIEFYIRVVKFK